MFRYQVRLASGSPNILHQPGNASLLETASPQHNSRASNAQFLRNRLVWTTDSSLQHNLSTAHNLLGCPARIHKRLQLLLLVGVDLEWGCRTKHPAKIC